MGIKYKVNENFFNTWTTNMAYVLGFWYADGSVEYSPSIRGHYIRVSSVDREILESIRNAMSSQHTIITRTENGVRDRYLLRIGNKKLFHELHRLGVVERKSLILSFPAVPTEFQHAFIRGYFDGDGCVHIERHTNGRNIKRLTTVFTSGSDTFLEKLNEILHTAAGIQNNKKIVITKGGYGSTFQLRFSTKNSLLLFRYLYPKNQKSHLCLQRKYDIFMRYISEKEIQI
jgi:intein/homing endonuclease